MLAALGLLAASALPFAMPTLAAGAGPVADFAVTPEAPLAFAPAQFNDTSVPGAAPIVAWLWGFGDGAGSTAQNPTHTYLQGGPYAVNLTVTDAAGASATASKTVHVCQPGVNFQELLTDPPNQGFHLHVNACVVSGGPPPIPDPIHVP
jgi:PKD repeat protein